MKKYKINENFFDEINTEEKAYWLGFLWADGYVARRERVMNNKPNVEYNIKLELAQIDKNHLFKFVKSLSSSHPVKRYKNSDFNKCVNYTERVFITNMHMGQKLQDCYGIIPRRHEFLKYSHLIPFELSRHFIRGIFDGDGSLSFYTANDRGFDVRKISVSFTTCPEILEFIEGYLTETKSCVENVRKRYKRHKEEDRDINCRSLIFSGRIQGINVLNEIYRDATVYLDRKYEKYLEAIKFMA